MQIQEKKAIGFYNKKDYAAALRAFLALDPADLERTDILIFIANCYDAVGHREEAVKYYKKALKLSKNSDVAAANLAIIYYEMKNIKFAVKYAEKALEINPENVSALSLMGNIHYQKRHLDKALKFYQAATEEQRDFYTPNYNSAGIYFELKDFNTAYFYIKKTLQYYPDSEEAKIMLANIYMELEKYEEAKEVLLLLYKNKLEDYWLCNLLSQAYQKNKEDDKALETGWLAVKISKGEESQNINFGYLLYEIAIERSDVDVKKYARKWLTEYPDSPAAQHMGRALLNAEQPSQINSDFVREIFDVFADDFDMVLSGLDYSVPSLMSKFLDSLARSVPLKKMRILDVGCGTGLCGQYLKKYALRGKLDGVDISEKMLQVAHSKKLYDHLFNQDLGKFLYNHKNKYNLINAADVFTYFGDLENLFYLLYTSLRKNGRILFSISENNLNDRDYFLHLSGRFVHRQKYVEKVLSKTGFVIEKINRVKLRNEGEKEVYGWIVLAQKEPM